MGTCGGGVLEGEGLSLKAAFVQNKVVELAKFLSFM